jgi:hypothetical protein
MILVSLVLLPAIDVSLRLRGYARTRESLLAWSSPPRSPLADADVDGFVAIVAQAVSIAGRRSLWRTTCLRQALLLEALLARRGVESELRIGVRNSAATGFGAHAWVERAGRVLIGGEKVANQHHPMH